MYTLQSRDLGRGLAIGKDVQTRTGRHQLHFAEGEISVIPQSIEIEAIAYRQVRFTVGIEVSDAHLAERCTCTDRDRCCAAERAVPAP
jgi:hypothetical protein